jgi:hypothetical protein
LDLDGRPARNAPPNRRDYPVPVSTSQWPLLNFVPQLQMLFDDRYGK